MNRLQNSIPLSEITSVKNITWPELFGVVARGLLAFSEKAAQILAKKHSDLPTEELQTLLIDQLAFYAVAAADAAATGRGLAIHQKGMISFEDYKKKSYANASKGGKAKSDKYAPLKEYVIQEYVANHSEKTNRHAAQIISKTCPEELLIDDSQPGNPPLLRNPVERFAVWIGEYKRNSTPKLY